MTHKKYGLEKHGGGSNSAGIIVYESNYKEAIQHRLKRLRKKKTGYYYRIKLFPKWMRYS